MKLSRRKTWKVPHPKDSYVEVCVFNNFLFSKGLSDTRVAELFNLRIEKHWLAVYQVKPCPWHDGSMTGDIL